MPNSRQFRSFNSASFAFVTVLFVLYNLTGTNLMRVFAPADKTTAKRVTAPPAAAVPADLPSSGDNALDLIIFRAGERHGVDPLLLHAVIWQESKYDPDVESQRGARGLMQLMPATARRFDCDDTADRQANVAAGTKYLSYLLKRFDGDVALALAGYNAGEGAVDRYNGVPPFAQTRDYIRTIIDRYGKTHHP